MDGNNEQDEERAQLGDFTAAEGDGDRGRYSLLVRCASQSSLDESSQRPLGGGEPAHDPPSAHPARLLDALARLRRDAALCDVVIQAQAEGAAAAGAGVAAHRAVLAAASPYFLAMFTQFEERSQPCVTIQNIEPHALEAIIEYIYNPESLDITEDNVQSLLAGASLVQVWGVRAACCAFLAAALQPDNALGIRAFADHHACADLAHAAARYIHAHAAQVLESEEFLALDADTLCQLLESDRITVPNEEVILDAVIRWMQHDPEKRSPSLGAALEHVRLPLLPQDVLVARAAAEPLASASVRVKDLVIEALSFHLLRPERRAEAALRCARARARAGGRGVALLVAGGQAPKAIREVEVLVLGGAGVGAGAEAQWRSAAPLPARRCRAGLVRHGDSVYAVGGFNGSLRVRSVDVYDVAADAWAAGPPLCARRSTLGVAAVGDVIYAVGGFDGVTGLSSAEALDTTSPSPAWRPIAGMSTRRSSVGVGVLGGRLYAVGGYDGASRQCLHTVERYDPALDAWEAVAPMAARRSGAGVGAVGGALYAVGGHDGPAVRRSVERLRPGGGGGGGGASWAPAPPMHTQRRNAAVAAHKGRLLVVGGDDGAANLDTVEVFDPASSQWTVVCERMAVARSYAGVCVVECVRPGQLAVDGGVRAHGGGAVVRGRVRGGVAGVMPRPRAPPAPAAPAPAPAQPQDPPLTSAYVRQRGPVRRAGGRPLARAAGLPPAHAAAAATPRPGRSGERVGAGRGRGRGGERGGGGGGGSGGGSGRGRRGRALVARRVPDAGVQRASAARASASSPWFRGHDATGIPRAWVRVGVSTTRGGRECGRARGGAGRAGGGAGRAGGGAGRAGGGAGRGGGRRARLRAAAALARLRLPSAARELPPGHRRQPRVLLRRRRGRLPARRPARKLRPRPPDTGPHPPDDRPRPTSAAAIGWPTPHRAPARPAPPRSLADTTFRLILSLEEGS